MCCHCCVSSTGIGFQQGSSEREIERTLTVLSWTVRCPARSDLGSTGVWDTDLLLAFRLRCKSTFSGWHPMLQRLHAGLAWRCRQTFVLENLTSYELHFFETYLVAPTAASLKCCGFCGFGQVRFLLETTGKETAPQKRRSQCPKCPFCIRSGHQS